MSVARNTAYNLIGSIVPIGVTLITVPLYLELIGAARYGIIAIFWTITGSLGVLSLGMGPALTHRMASARRATPSYRSQLVWTALVPTLVAGLFGALLVWVIGQIYFSSFASGHGELGIEIRHAMPLVALALPLTLTGNVFVGALQARQHFITLNFLQIASSVLTAVVPLVIARFAGPQLPGLVFGTVAVSAAMLLTAALICRNRIPIRAPVRLRLPMLCRLLRFGGWLSLSSSLTPILMTIDRLVIGSLLNPSAVAAYVIPYNLTQRLILLPNSLSTALFPRLAAGNEKEKLRLEGTSIDALASLLTPAAIGGIAIIGPFLSIWLGAGFAASSGDAGVILALGFWANGISFIAITLLWGRERPDIVAKFQLMSFPAFIALLYLLTTFLGIFGTAIAFAMRAFADWGMFYWARAPLAALKRLGGAAIIVMVVAAASLRLDWHDPIYWVVASIGLSFSMLLYRETYNVHFLTPFRGRISFRSSLERKDL